MKTHHYFYFVFALFISSFTACSYYNHQEEEMDHQPLTSFKSEGPAVINLTCSGNCPDGDRCRFIVVGNNQFGECDCEGCVLVIHMDGEALVSSDQSNILKKLSDQYLFKDKLNEFVLNRFGTDDYGILSLEYATYEKDYYIQYDFITDSGQTESVMFVFTAGSDDKGPGGSFTVDCSGSCTDPDETCRERYVFNPPSVECTCEGDGCKMKMIHH